MRVLLLATAIVLVPVRLWAAVPAETAAPGWTAKMRALEATLNRLLVDISSDRRFNDKNNFKSIQKTANRFAALAHSLGDKTGKSPDKDASLLLIGTDFAAEADYAAKNLSAGHRPYARVILNSMVGYCIACHTRTGIGPQFSATKLEPGLESLPPVAKGNYFVAIRNFDRALAEYGKVTSDPDNARSDPSEYAKALRAGLSVAVRVKHDPDLALKLVENVIGNAKAPFYLKELAGEWKRTILEWKAEKPAPSTDPEKLFETAARLVAHAKATQKFPADRSADVIYLRASGVIHDLLGQAPVGLTASNSLYLAGLTYDVLDDYGVKDFSEFYYRSCIRVSPHTEIARDCYRRYEESVYFGYTGSGGTYIPSDVRARLDALEMLSVSESSPKPKSPVMQ